MSIDSGLFTINQLTRQCVKTQDQQTVTSFTPKLKQINMADLHRSSISHSSSVTLVNVQNGDSQTAVAVGVAGPPVITKRVKLDPDADPLALPAQEESKLEQRLGGILCCAVCLDLPPAAIYQCSNGHLMCVGCFMHLLADARLRDETSTCPNCRVEICRTLAVRNLAVEKAVQELPTLCTFCAQPFPKHLLPHHERVLCPERIVRCNYERLGCVWRGPWRLKEEHGRTCVYLQLTGTELLPILESADNLKEQRELRLNQIFDLLSYEKIAFNDLQLKAYRTEEYVHQLYYESSRFSAFGQQWVVKAKIVSPVKDPTQASQRSLAYQLILKSRNPAAMGMHFLVLKGPFGDLDLVPAIYHFEFQSTDANNKLESTWEALPLAEGVDCNHVLSNKMINFRMIMFWAIK